MQKKLTVLFAFAIFVLVVGWAITPAQAHDCIDQNHKRENHPHCNGDPTPDPDPEPIIKDCTESLCIADVGLDGTPPTTGGRPSNQYALLYSGMPVTRIPSPKFNKILKALTENELTPQNLCAAYDVLIFNWGIPKIKNLNWPQLRDDYMACGGGIIFEDQTNVGALADVVPTIEVDRHGRETPILVTLEPVPVLTLGPPLDDANLLPGFKLSLVNTHIVFADTYDPQLLTPFLSLVNGDVVGLYGEFGNGRIVFSGPDNNWHGIGNSNDQQKEDHTALLFNEINWVRHTICGNDITEPPLEQCDDGNQNNTDDCTNACLFGGGG